METGPATGVKAELAPLPTRFTEPLRLRWSEPTAQRVPTASKEAANELEAVGREGILYGPSIAGRASVLGAGRVGKEALP